MIVCWCQACTYKTIKPKQRNNYRRAKNQQRNGDDDTPNTFIIYIFTKKLSERIACLTAIICCFFPPKDTGTSIIFIHPSTGNGACAFGEPNTKKVRKPFERTLFCTYK